MSLGETIRSLLELRDLRQEDFAALMGVSQSTVSDWIQGNHFPHRRRIPDMAKALGCTEAHLKRAWWSE